MHKLGLMMLSPRDRLPIKTPRIRQEMPSFELLLGFQLGLLLLH